MKYYIINDCDRPYEAHVAYEDGEYLYYLHPVLADFGRVSKSNEMTPIEKFGIEVSEMSGGIFFSMVRESCATYRDGRRRLWQGRAKFCLPYPKEDR